MSDELFASDLSTLSRKVAELTEPPAFDSVVRRAARRRRAQMAGLAAGAMVTVAGAGIGITALRDGGRAADPVDDPTRPLPTQIIETPRQDTDLTVAKVVAAADLEAFAVAPDGSRLSVWRDCNHDFTVCPAAWRLVDEDGEMVAEDVLDRNRRPEVVAFDGGFAVKAYNSVGFTVSTDGRQEAISTAPATSDVQAGDLTLPHRMQRMLFRPSTGELMPFSAGELPDEASRVSVADDGTLWYASFSPSSISFGYATLYHFPATGPPRETGTGGETTLSTEELEVPGPVLVGPDRVAAFVVGDQGGIAQHLLIMDHEGRVLDRVETFPFRSIGYSGMTDEGTLLLLDWEGTLWRSSQNWTDFEAIRRDTDSLQVVGETAYVVGRDHMLHVSDDGGETWQPTPLR